jgi:electron-transferring-flavoprotein dehydrogenase
VLNEQGKVIGVSTGDFGISKNGEKKENYSRGIELLASQVVLSEGCRGSISEKVIHRFNLRDQKDLQTYGIGLKEVWEIKPENFKAGLVQHTVGWPLTNDLYGGSFMYHIEPNHCHIGIVVGLDYKNPYVNPYEEFQVIFSIKKKFLYNLHNYQEDEDTFSFQ